MKSTFTSPQKSNFPWKVIVISALLLLVACATTLNLIGGVIAFNISVGITLVLQFVIATILKRWPIRPAFKTTVLLIPAVLLSVLIGFKFNAHALKMDALQTALGTKPPADMTDLHVFESSFTDYVVFAFFRSSPNSVRKLITNPIYKRRDYKRDFDFSRRKDWKDLQHMGLVTNLTAYSRTDVVNGHGELWVDPEWRFVIVTYGVD